MTDRTESAAVECLALAAALDNGTVTHGLRAHVAWRLFNVPGEHMMRAPIDYVLDMVFAVQRGKATASGLRAFVGDLRDGAAEMVAQSWYRQAYGGAV